MVGIAEWLEIRARVVATPGPRHDVVDRYSALYTVLSGAGATGGLLGQTSARIFRHSTLYPRAEADGRACVHGRLA